MLLKHFKPRQVDHRVSGLFAGRRKLKLVQRDYQIGFLFIRDPDSKITGCGKKTDGVIWVEKPCFRSLLGLKSMRVSVGVYVPLQSINTRFANDVEGLNKC